VTTDEEPEKHYRKVSLRKLEAELAGKQQSASDDAKEA
jgi:hypothetical protein